MSAQNTSGASSTSDIDTVDDSVYAMPPRKMTPGQQIARADAEVQRQRRLRREGLECAEIDAADATDEEKWFGPIPVPATPRGWLLFTLRMIVIVGFVLAMNALDCQGR